ncbi:MAG: ABC transporter permease [Chloroflexota bacterium]|nr:ABC transporter permease [Anaerolineae bacterium]HMM26723.1 ABC transporter permease [Aggregatilineaceae bacterium]
MESAKPITLGEPARAQSAREVQWEQVRDTFRRLMRSPSARIGGFIVIVTIAIAAAVPLLDDYDATRDRDLPARYAEPDCIFGYIKARVQPDTPDIALSDIQCQHPFGADKNGRDIMRRVGHGMSVSLQSGLFAVALSVSVGTVAGIAAGFFGGLLESIVMRLMDVILSFPSLLLAVAIVTVAGPGLRNGMIAVAITQIPVFARLARSMAISIRNQEYVTAARSLGTRPLGILGRHVLPNSLAPLIVQATLGLGTAVIETAALGFLGLGQQPPFPELGKMLAESQQSLASGKWWVMVFPGAAIIMIVLGFNLLGDGLRDVLDPRLKK